MTTSAQPGTERCPAVTFRKTEQCLLKDNHQEEHRWPSDPVVMPKEKAPPTQWTVIQGLGTLALLLTFVAFLIAWFTR